VVALKVAEVAAAATVTDAGAVSVALVFVRVTRAPPAGAACVRVTVQVELLELFKEAGKQPREATPGKTEPPVTIPPVAKSAMPLPAGEDPALLLIPMAVVVSPAAMVRLTTAMAPFEMIPAFIAEASQVYAPETPLQLKVLPAAVRAAPAVTEMATTLAGGYVNVHSIADGSLPAGDVTARFRATLPFAAAVADERARESGPVCPKEARAEIREATARISAILPGVADSFVESFV
jgi:hypothetical protein